MITQLSLFLKGMMVIRGCEWPWLTLNGTQKNGYAIEKVKCRVQTLCFFYSIVPGVWRLSPMLDFIPEMNPAQATFP